MEAAPQQPTPEDKKITAERLQRARDFASVLISGAIAASSPIGKVTKAPDPGTPPLATEKIIVRPKDMDDAALKDEIEQRRAVFEINKAGEVKRVVDSKNSA